MSENEISVPIAAQDAISLFQRLGFDVAGMSPEAIKVIRRQLLNQYHPDRGGDLNTAQLINAAYDLLKNGVPNTRSCGARLT
jgi:curved DNA-binding protein CbpA